MHFLSQLGVRKSPTGNCAQEMHPRTEEVLLATPVSAINLDVGRNWVLRCPQSLPLGIIAVTAQTLRASPSLIGKCLLGAGTAALPSGLLTGISSPFVSS